MPSRSPSPRPAASRFCASHKFGLATGNRSVVSGPVWPDTAIVATHNTERRHEGNLAGSSAVSGVGGGGAGAAGGHAASCGGGERDRDRRRARPGTRGRPAGGGRDGGP